MRVTVSIASGQLPAVTPKSDTFFQRAWPPTVLILGSVATVAWTAFLTYGLVMIIARVI
jgi:hypothetical protein